MSTASVPTAEAFPLLPNEYLLTYQSGRIDVIERGGEIETEDGPEPDGDTYVGRIEQDSTTGALYLGCLACGDAIERSDAGCCEACRLDMANDEANYDAARADV